ncbi:MULTISPECIES: hypothetical protein [unclassified Acinetobacter]|uniref:hypothetical protein n=1 Tax=unclassified Acinetobacter TaxID=196816 RepID=UPI00293445F6|nr:MULTISPECIES: hypothetical protein [unclassified Acinetobacter]WOE31979.1 hypothetical protein QSG84_01765 [Acinetobacter sp. SAAs470]WOE37447.1 hypothetical protein QSG86_10810 [Acinetobacter sp. SAAs474]
MNSELIYQALFAQLSKIDGLVTTSRRLQHFNHVPPERRPALFVTQGNQTEVPVKGLDAKIELEAEVYIYIYESDSSIPPSVQLNQMIDKVRMAIAPEYPEMCEYQTLDGLVEHCWIEGTIEVFEAVENMLDDQGIAIIPIRILTTN